MNMGAVRQGGISHDKGVSQALQCRGQVGLRFRHLRDTGYLLIAAGPLRIYIDACGVSRGPPAENPSPLREPSRAKPVQAPGRCVTSTRWHRATAQAGDVSGARVVAALRTTQSSATHSGIRITPAVWYRQIFPGKKEIMARQSAAMRKSIIAASSGDRAHDNGVGVNFGSMPYGIPWVGQCPARGLHVPGPTILPCVPLCATHWHAYKMPAPRARHEEGARGG